jgi:hypothetical protein
MCGQSNFCPHMYKGLQRVMVPSHRWLELVLVYGPAKFGGFARCLRERFRPSIREVTTLLPELPRSALWDVSGAPPCGALPEERGIDWDGRNAVPRDLFWFWTDEVMGRFEASYAERVGRFRAGVAEELYSGECVEYVGFADAIDPAALRGAASDGGGAGGSREDFFEGLSDRHFLFELRHSWRFVFGDRLKLPIAHIRGQDVWRVLEGGQRGDCGYL